MRFILKFVIGIGFAFNLVVDSSYSQPLPPINNQGDSLPAPTREELIQGIPPLRAQRELANADVFVTVKKYRLNGNTAFSNAELQDLLVDSIGKPLDFLGLNQVADKISRFYRVKGYSVARAYLPAQRSSDGVIDINIIEGVFDKINLSNKSSITDERIYQILAHNLCDQNINSGNNCSGELIRDQSLERAILLIKDLPGTTVNSNLMPGFKVGSSNLGVDVSNTKTIGYGLGIDNFGSPSTGTTRLNANVDINHLSDNADQLSFSIATTTLTKTKTGNITYIIPTGYLGQRLGISFSRNQYRLGAGFDATQANGISDAVSIFTTYPIIRGINNTLYARLSGEVREARNNVDLIGASFHNKANVIRMGINGDYVDNFGGGGYMVYGSNLHFGHIGSNVLDDVVKSTGHFNKFSYNVARQQTLTGAMTLYAALSGQHASKNLDASEQIGLGGPTSVRGYAGEAGGSSGANSTVELRYTTPVQISNTFTNITYGIFGDRGWIQYYKNIPQGTAVDVANTRAISSYGLSLTFQSQERILTSSTSANYFLRIMLGMHSMVAGQASIINPASRSKLWVQGSMAF